MLNTDLRRWIVTALVVLAIVALVAWARNGPGVGGREPDPPQSVALIRGVTTVAPAS